LAPEAAARESGWLARAARRARLGPLLSSLLFSTRFVTIWLATGLLVIVCQLVAPQTLSSDSLSSVLPLAAIVGIAALGQMMVVMTGGIDLSMAGAISLLANIVVGASGGSNDRLVSAIFVVLGWAVVIGLVNGIFVAVLEFNPLIVTLSVGLVLEGLTVRYRFGTANESAVPPSLSNWVFRKPALGISWVFWVGLLLTAVLALVLRSTSAGRRFRSVGANPRAAWIAGIRVRRYVVSAYIASALAAGAGAILLAGVIQNPDVDPGHPYLFAPIAAVVLAGTSLTGGLSSVTSTWVAAFALTLLNQMLRVLGLSTALQYVVFGGAIIVGMVVSGDRIAALLGRLLQRPSVAAFLGHEGG
jgi:ribose transport system permease protein